jgi:hypothetical protein
MASANRMFMISRSRRVNFSSGDFAIVCYTCRTILLQM